MKSLFSRKQNGQFIHLQDPYPKRVFHVITTLERGGAENQLLILVRAQIMSGFDVTVIPLKGGSGLENEFISSGAKICDLRMHGTVLAQIRALRSTLPKEYHMLHAHLPQGELTSRFARNRKSVFLITRHFGGQFYPSKNSRLSGLLSRLATSRAEAIIAISDAVKMQLIANSEVKNIGKIEKIYYGFDCVEFKGNIGNGQKSQFIRSQNHIIIGTIARLSNEKDYPTIFKAFKALSESNPMIYLRIAGVGPLAEELHDLARDLGIEERIRWEGKINNVPQFLQEIDIFVLASKFEGFGMVLVEAMCMHKRIVAAGNSALLEVLGDKGAGVFFETGDCSSLALKISESLAADPDDFIPRQDDQLLDFSVEKLISKTNNLYKRISERLIQKQI
jgi:glycosyltransferase involved in cell wall biosynthesis